jgi:hypothetical protein
MEFPVRLKIKSTEIICKLNAHNGEETCSRPSIYVSYNKFPEGRKLVSNLPHADVQATAVRDVKIRRVKELILEKRQITVRDTGHINVRPQGTACCYVCRASSSVLIRVQRVPRANSGL